MFQGESSTYLDRCIALFSFENDLNLLFNPSRKASRLNLILTFCPIHYGDLVQESDVPLRWNYWNFERAPQVHEVQRKLGKVNQALEMLLICH